MGDGYNGVRVLERRLVRWDFPLARPFGFGMVRLTSLRHAVLLCRCDVGGREVWGLASENLAPKWFEKDPAKSLDDDVRALAAIVSAAADLAVGRQASDPYQFYRALAADAVAAIPAPPPLARQLGVSLVERAVLDAWCRRWGLPFHRLLAGDGPGLGLTLDRTPATALRVRHTVGLADDLADLPGELDRAGIDSLKIKLSGDLPADLDRLAAIGRAVPHVARLTLDGNENFRAPDDLAALLAALLTPEANWTRDRLAWVEQPLNRAAALADETGPVLRRFPQLPVIIDESDASPDDLPRALSLGYAGTSHKNCKGVFKSVLARQRLSSHQLLSGEDLTIVAPWSMAADLAVASAVGVTDVERNGHHYADGLAGLPTALQQLALLHHPDLYHRDHGTARLSIHRGHLDCASANLAPLGWAAPHPERLAEHLPALVE